MRTPFHHVARIGSAIESVENLLNGRLMAAKSRVFGVRERGSFEHLSLKTLPFRRCSNINLWFKC